MTSFTTINEDDLKIGSTIGLPALEVLIKQSIGIIAHTISKKKQLQIIAINAVKISPRITENAYEFSNGTKVIITQRKKVILPDNIDGVLIFENGELRWQSHKEIQAFGKRIADDGLKLIQQEIRQSWINEFQYKVERKDNDGNVIDFGLRPPQIGGLHSIGSHWSLTNQAATLIMPTGTGKTETILASMIAFNPGITLIVVPSQALRDQTFHKCCTHGLLRLLGNIPEQISNPIVGVITSRPNKIEDLEIFEKCNVLVSTMSALSENSINALGPEIAKIVDYLVIDEAHHIAAEGWNNFKEHFVTKKTLQFTATPYRRDGKLVDGKIIFEYPLSQAQKDNYFKKINFNPIHEIDAVVADTLIAEAAIQQLRLDRQAGLDHLIMARCVDITRATEVYEIYKKIGAEFNPVLVHSKESTSSVLLQKLFTRESRIVICVNMLGEGFDLPQLKIAAVHDVHKSLAILLQFTGRFTRTAADDIGEATVIANIGKIEVSQALERLYSEDADWNHLLSELSSQAAKSHARLVEFLSQSKRLDESIEEDHSKEISNSLLHPTFNTMVYSCENFDPKNFHKGVSENMAVQRVWFHQESNTIYFVTRVDYKLKWTNSKNIKDREWHLFVLHYDQQRNLLFYSSTDKSMTYEKIISSVGGLTPLNGEQIFRCLGRINRLLFQNIGVKKHGRRNLRFAMYVGADVVQALTMTEKGSSSKSNLSGIGWENGEPITIGCSYKGRVWARDKGTIPELLEWCENVGEKLIDNSIDPSKIIENVLIPKEITTFPKQRILSIEWPIEVLRKSDEKVIFHDQTQERPISMIDISVEEEPSSDTQINFAICLDVNTYWATYSIELGGADGFIVKRMAGPEVKIKLGKLDVSVEEFFSNYPPMIRFIDLSELDGNLLITPQNPQILSLPDECFETWDWNGTDITKESMWKNDAIRQDSIQWRVAQEYLGQNFEVVFDDDAAGESADLVCLKEELDFITLTLIHCKFTAGQTPGERVKDVVEVSSQAIRSTKWKWKFKDLCTHILSRDRRLKINNRTTRFLKGSPAEINRFAQISRFKEIKMEILIVQPGLSKNNTSPDQRSVLGSAHSYLKETVGIDLAIICSE